MRHCCGSAVLSKRPTLVFCSNVALWRVCVCGKCAIITLHPDFAILPALATYSAFFTCWTDFKINHPMRATYCSNIQKFNKAFRSARHSIFLVCVINTFYKLNITERDEGTIIMNTGWNAHNSRYRLSTHISVAKGFAFAVIDGC